MADFIFVLLIALALVSLIAGTVIAAIVAMDR